MSNFAIRLKELRLNKKISQEQLATYLGMKRENISNYERGIVTNVTSETLDKLANYFNVSTDYILGRSDNPTTIDLNSTPSKPKVKILARKMDGLDDSQLDAIDGLIDNFFDKKFGKKDDSD